MTEIIAFGASLWASALLVLYGLGGDGPFGLRHDQLLTPMIVLAVVGVVAARRHRAAESERALRAHGLRRLTFGRDVVYVPREDDEE